MVVQEEMVLKITGQEFTMPPVSCPALGWEIYFPVGCSMTLYIVRFTEVLDFSVRYQSCGPTLDLRALYLQGILYTARTLRNWYRGGHFANSF